MIAITDRTPQFYYDQTPFQTNTLLTPLDELFLQFESEVVARLGIITEVCTSNANLFEECTLCNNFKRWIDFSSREMELLCLKDTQRNFHAKFSGIVQPLLHKAPPTLLLPAPKMIPHTQETLSEQLNLVSSNKTFEVGVVSIVVKTLISKEVILKILEELKVENDMVKERLDKQDGIFKAQVGTNNKIN